MSTGSGLTTKGLVGGGGGSDPEPIPEQLLPPEPPPPLPMDVGVPTGSVVIVVPTAPNVVLMAAENITVNLRARQAASLELPSLYKRAYMVAHETDEMAIVKPR